MICTYNKYYGKAAAAACSSKNIFMTKGRVYGTCMGVQIGEETAKIGDFD